MCGSYFFGALLNTLPMMLGVLLSDYVAMTACMLNVFHKNLGNCTK